jgi:hypothetical protein
MKLSSVALALPPQHSRSPVALTTLLFIAAVLRVIESDMRIWLGWLGVLVACGPDPLPPPPTETAATCVYTTQPDRGHPPSTIYYDSMHRAIRVDGWTGNDGDFIPAEYDLAYDEMGRLLEEKTPDEGDFYWTYAPDQVTQTNGNYEMDFTLVGGLLSHVESVPSFAGAPVTIQDFTRDAAGNIVRWTGQSVDNNVIYPYDKSYTYDEQQRPTSVSDGHYVTTLAYTETADQLVVNIKTPGSIPTDRWTYDFDAQHRIVSMATDANLSGVDDVTTFTYSDVEIVETSENQVIHAVGMCDAPSVVTMARHAWLPVQWFAEFDGLQDPIDILFASFIF